MRKPHIILIAKEDQAPTGSPQYALEISDDAQFPAFGYQSDSGITKGIDNGNRIIAGTIIGNHNLILAR